MSAAELLKEITGQGIRIINNGGKIKCVSPRPIPGDIVTRLKEHKQTILQLLEDGQTNKPATISPDFWIDDHYQELKAVGFTDEDLFGSKYKIGVVALRIWTKPGLAVTLKGDVLCFTWKEPTGIKITQTARPERKRAC